jgi:hypothetical protein
MSRGRREENHDKIKTEKILGHYVRGNQVRKK